jgi:SAM-dependent methyltransferase
MLDVPELETEHPIAVSSNDTLYPKGSKNDNSICLRFNRILNTWVGNNTRLKVLDLGCAGGGMVRSLLDDGHFAVGLEGSDYPLVNQIGEWPTISRHLFTCDITKPFQLSDSRTGELLLFDVITAWEVMEHIPEESLPGLLANMQQHLAPGGHLICSIATSLDEDPATGVRWHVTVKPQEWWVNRFREAGFVVSHAHPFTKNDYVRGSGHCRGDWPIDANPGFHLVMHRLSDAQSESVSEFAA